MLVDIERYVLLNTKSIFEMKEMKQCYKDYSVVQVHPWSMAEKYEVLELHQQWIKSLV